MCAHVYFNIQIYNSNNNNEIYAKHIHHVHLLTLFHRAQSPESTRDSRHGSCLSEHAPALPTYCQQNSDRCSPLLTAAASLIAGYVDIKQTFDVWLQLVRPPHHWCCWRATQQGVEKTIAVRSGLGYPKSCHYVILRWGTGAYNMLHDVRSKIC